MDLELGKWLGVGGCAKSIEKEKEAKDLALGNGQMREYKKECMESQL